MDEYTLRRISKLEEEVVELRQQVAKEGLIRFTFGCVMLSAAWIYCLEKFVH
jgi:hypothetical protein